MYYEFSSKYRTRWKNEVNAENMRYLTASNKKGDSIEKLEKLIKEAAKLGDNLVTSSNLSSHTIEELKRRGFEVEYVGGPEDVYIISW